MSAEKKKEVRVFLEPKIIEWLKKKQGTYGLTLSEVIRTMLLTRYQQEERSGLV